LFTSIRDSQQLKAALDSHKSRRTRSLTATSNTANLASSIASQKTSSAKVSKKAEDHDDDAGVCVDRRTPEQKEADKQNAADGKDGRYSFKFEDGYYCKHKGFVCVDGRKCYERLTNRQVGRR
jgi:hypothetical protein